ncbi:MAG TPA: hypothetical protein VEX86_20130 [Longimicrobium sp.]|nr:hypothetical protein [Longimicrobium sp.]
MTFRVEAVKVRDPERSIWLRLSSLRSCIRRMCHATGERFDDAGARYGIGRPAPWPAPPDESLLLAVLEDVEARRAPALERRRAFDAARRQSKRQGNRQLSKLDRAELRRVRDPAADGIVSTGRTHDEASHAGTDPVRRRGCLWWWP